MDKCFLCKSKERDEVKFGEFMTHGDISVHYFCLLLTSNLMQRGRDDQGFLGFLVTDIKTETKRVAPAVCCYCKKKSANISCCAAKCRRTFHLTCGVHNDAENQFVGTFKSYCDRHVTGKKTRRPAPNDTCYICYEDIMGESGKFNCVTMLRAPCCKNGWFHKWCLAAFAKSAGYFFKCPLCNDNKVFRQRLVYKGVFIPDRDAAWELEPNAFAELLERPKECCAVECIAKGGRTSCSNRNKLMFCGSCGSVAIHHKCMTIPSDTFYCQECTPIISALNSSSIINISSSDDKSDKEDEDEDIDVCGEDDDVPALSNPQLQDSDEDEGTVHPLGRIRKNVLRILDDEVSDDDEVDIEDDDVIVPHVHKRVRQLLSSDDESTTMSPYVTRSRAGSRDVESLFDSGAESDRSGSSGEKYNIKSAPSNCNTVETLDNTANQIAKLEPQENLKEKTKRGRKYTTIKDSPVENWCTPARTRRQSTCAEIYYNSHKADNEVKCYPILLRRKSAVATLSPANDVPRSNKSATSIVKSQFQAEEKTRNGIKNTPKANGTASALKCDKRGDNGFVNAAFMVHETIQDSPSKKLNSRPRTNSEDPSMSLPALQRTRRSSFLRSPYSTPPQSGQRRGSSTELLSIGTRKRSRSSSLTPSTTTPNKRHKNSKMSDENENNCHDVDALRGRRPSRGRSPLSSNLCSLYAFITPEYVKKKDPHTADISSVIEPNQPVAAKVGKHFSKDKSNIPKNVELDKPAVNIESNNTAHTNDKQLKTAKDTFPHSYNMLVRGPGRPPNSLKSRHRGISHGFSKQNLPCNQTRIESYFKRI